MNVVLWIIAILLALAFAAAGAMKLMRPKEELEPNMGWVADFTQDQVKAIGLAEVLGAVGLILPGAIDIAPVLVPIAAVGLVATMVGAVVVHRRRNDPMAMMAPATVLGVLAAVVAIGRFGPASF